MDPEKRDQKGRIVNDLLDRFSNTISGIALASVLAVAGGVGWIIRTVFTDRQRVDALEKSLGAMKDDVDVAMADLKTDIRTLTTHLLEHKP